MSAQTQTPAPGGFDDQRIEIIIGTLLRTGVLLAAAVVLAGAIMYLARYGHGIPDYKSFHGEPERLKSLTAIFHGAIATPIARVLFSAIAFAIERDYVYVLVTLIVLGILCYSLFGSN
jgi:uncharacterized membrane protein